MKIYCLLIDAMPLVEELEIFAKRKGFELSKQISSCFTTPTIHGMLTGQLTSDLLPKGIGYHSIGRKDISEFKWFHDLDINLIDILKSEGYKFDVCGDRLAWIARDILCVPILSDKFTYKLEPTIKNHHETFYSFDKYEEPLKSLDRFSHVEMISSNSNETRDFSWEQYRDPVLREEFYKNEKINISKEQKKEGDIFCLWQNLEWSDLTWGSKTKTREEAIENIMQWLSFWDTEEEDSYFWIFSDHGDKADDLMSPKSYLSWVMTKDNSKQKSSANAKSIISYLDFYKTILNKINYVKSCNSSYDIYGDLDTERLYFFEDSRMHSCLTHAQGASVVKVLYKEDIPMNLVQLSYNTNLYSDPYIFQHDFKTEESMQGTANLDEAEIKLLNKKLLERIEWLPQ